MQRVLGNLGSPCLRNELARQERTALILQTQLKRQGHVFGHLIGQCGLLHQLLQNAVIQDVVFELLILVRQVVLQGNHMAQSDILAVHRRQNGRGVLRGGWHRNADSKAGCTQKCRKFAHETWLLLGGANPRAVDTILAASYITEGLGQLRLGR